MANALPAGIPPLEETSYSRERILDALRHDVETPSGAIAVATAHVDGIEADVLAVLERARHEDLDEPSANLLFRGIHILGGRRLTSAYRPLVALLQGPNDRVEWLLGDAITENLSYILAGVFDGDEKPLLSLILDGAAMPFVREAALHALAFMAFERRTDPAGFEAFLRRFDEDKLATADDAVMWHAWMSVIGALGLTSLGPRVRAAFADGRIAPEWCDEDDFNELLKAAIERPDDRTRLKHEQMGYLEDVVEALEKFPAYEPHFDETSGADGDVSERSPDWLPGFPSHNPFRDVGRNDPCPCGSGKKFKKCCLHKL
jgi:hypothetical protein